MLKKHKTKIITYPISIILGATGGYLYWYFVGCSGGCPITANYTSSLIGGAIIGWLTGDTIVEQLSKSKTETESVE